MTAAVSSVSCGGDGGGATCSMVAPCGGDIVGNWQVTSSCVKLMGTLNDANCPTLAVTASLEVTGTSSFGADLTYTDAFILTGTETLHLPRACLTSSQGITLTCDHLNQMAAANPDPSFTSFNCTASGSACNCVATLAPTVNNETGTYVVSGGLLTTTENGGTPSEPEGYCVKGTTLDRIPPLSMGEPGVTVTGDLTLTRR